MKKIKFTRYIAAAVLAMIPFIGVSYAQQDTGSSGGQTIIVNDSDPMRCYIIFRNDGGRQEFCLRRGDELQTNVVRGDRYTCVEGNYTPPNNCDRWVIDLPRDHYCIC